jgi:DNA replicative helicase MCM subunit Mcm2 (Cdc46/Mcm family)
MKTFECETCGEEVVVDYDPSDPNDSTAWCEKCNDYATGFDVFDYMISYSED